MRAYVAFLSALICTHAVAQLATAKRLVAQPPTVASANTLLALTQASDAETRSYLLENWGKIGQAMCEQVARVEGRGQGDAFCTRLVEAIADHADGPSKADAMKATRALASLCGSLVGFEAEAYPGCGNVVGPVLPTKSSEVLSKVFERKSGMFLDCLLGATPEEFNGLAMVTQNSPHYRVKREALRRLDSRNTAERTVAAWHAVLGLLEVPDAPRFRLALEDPSPVIRSWMVFGLRGKDIRQLYGPDAKKWPTTGRYLYCVKEEPNVDAATKAALLSDPDPTVRLAATLKWSPQRFEDIEYLRKAASLPDRHIQMSLWGIVAKRPFSFEFELAKFGCPEFVARLLSEANSYEEFLKALDAFGDEVLRTGNGPEAEGLYKFWPRSRAHLNRMLDSKRFESRYVAASVLVGLDPKLFEPGELNSYLQKILADPDVRAAELLTGRYAIALPDSVLEPVYVALFNRRDRALTLKFIDRFASIGGDSFLRLCAESDDPQYREAGRAILAKRAGQ